MLSDSLGKIYQVHMYLRARWPIKEIRYTITLSLIISFVIHRKVFKICIISYLNIYYVIEISKFIHIRFGK